MTVPTFSMRHAVAVCLIVLGCGQDYNSNSGDERLGGGPPADVSCATPSEARFCGASAIINKYCGTCHPDMGGFKNDAEWVASGRVVVGSSSTSTVITRLINAGSNMPQGGSALPTDEYEALRAWVDQMPSPTGGG